MENPLINYRHIIEQISNNSQRVKKFLPIMRKLFILFVKKLKGIFLIFQKFLLSLHHKTALAGHFLEKKHNLGSL